MKTVLFFVLVLAVKAAEFVAASPSTTDILAKYALCASSGDTIFIPAGTATWASVLSVTTKSVNFVGTGTYNSDMTYTDRTIIEGGSDGGTMMDLGTTTSSISGMTFHHNATTSGSATVLLVRGQNVRIFNNNFVGVLTKVRALTITGTGSTIPHPTGVAWHNRFTDARAADCEGDLVTPYGGCRIWANADTFAALGNGNNWFTEDCRVQKTVNVGQNMFDMAYGGHVVIRYNLLIDHSIYGHGYDSTGTHERSTLSMEVYGNTIQQVTLSQGDPPVWYNGGYGVVWNNTVTGTWNLNRIQLDYPDVTGKGPGDYPLQDQPGRGIDASLWDGHTLPAPAQALTPLYEWNNTLNGGTLDFVVKTGRETWIVSGRDFYNNTVMPGYTPYPYPHPLRGYRFPGRKGKAATIYH